MADGLYASEGADRSPPSKRSLRGWPLPSVRLNRVISAETDLVEGVGWPPPRMNERTERLAVLDRLWDGNMSDFVGDPKAVTTGINYFRRVVKVIADLLTTTGPQPELVGAAADVVINACLYGRGYLVAAGGEVWSPQTSQVWEDVDGGLHIVEGDYSLEAPDGTFDRLRGVTITDGAATRWLRSATASMVGELLEETSLGSAVWSYVDNPPVRDRWGHSMILDLVPPVVGIALRLTGAEKVLAANEAPTTVIPAPDSDIANAVAGDETQPKQLSRLGRRIAQVELASMRSYDTVWGADGLQRGYTIEWSGNLENTWQLVDRLKGELRMLTGVGAALEQEGGDVPSGAALRQMFLTLWATTKQLHNLIVEAFAVVGVGVEWPNPFEEPLGQPEPEPEPEPDEGELMLVPEVTDA